MHNITRIQAQEIMDSRGKPTLSVTVCAGEHCGMFDVPSGASTGEREAVELRDEDGGMKRAIEKIENEIASALIGMNVTQQFEIDRAMISLDGTLNKSRLGGNSMIGVSIASARAAARAEGVRDDVYLKTLVDIPPSRSFPHLFVNLINGGKHAQGGSPIQEHQIVTMSEDPVQAYGAAEACEKALHALVRAEGRIVSIGDEGGAVFEVGSIEEPFELLRTAIGDAQREGEVVLGADAAASSFFEEGAYTLFGNTYSVQKLTETYQALHERLGLTFLEDPFHENAHDDFAELGALLPNLTIIGDDLTTTSARAIENASKNKIIRAVIIKPNQIGTLTETLDAMKTARSHDIHCIVSHRSGETNDVFIADLAHAFGCFGLKAGAPSKPERRLKYERIFALAAPSQNH